MKKIRRDTWESTLSADEKLQILRESEQKELSQETHRAKLEKDFGKPLSRSTYYRMLNRLQKIKPQLIAEVEAGKVPVARAIAVEDMPALTEIRAKLGAISKRLDIIDRRQSVMDMQLRSISAARKDAFVMYMNMRDLNRAIRNSSFVADALEITQDIPYPGKRNGSIDSIHAHLMRLDKETETRVDDFLLARLSKAFDKGDLTVKELFMLRLRLLFGCSLIDELENDLRIPLSDEEERTSLLFQCELDPKCLFVDLWKEMGDGWLCDSAVQIHRFGKLPTPYEKTVAQANRIKAYSQIRAKAK